MTGHFSEIRDPWLHRELKDLLYGQQRNVSRIALLTPDVGHLIRVRDNALRLIANPALGDRLRETFGPAITRVATLAAFLSKIGFAHADLDPRNVASSFQNRVFALELLIPLKDRLQSELGLAEGAYLAFIEAILREGTFGEGAQFATDRLRSATRTNARLASALRGHGFDDGLSAMTEAKFANPLTSLLTLASEIDVSGLADESIRSAIRPLPADEVAELSAIVGQGGIELRLPAATAGGLNELVVDRLRRFSDEVRLGTDDPPIIYEGDRDDGNFDLVLGGEVWIMVADRYVATLRQNALFGEMASVTGHRTASVLAGEVGAHLLRVPKLEFLEVCNNDRGVRHYLEGFIAARDLSGSFKGFDSHFTPITPAAVSTRKRRSGYQGRSRSRDHDALLRDRQPRQVQRGQRPDRGPGTTRHRPSGIQEVDPTAIIRERLQEARRQVEGELPFEDTSLSLSCLGGLPGPLIKWFLQSLGVEGLANLAARLGDDGSEAKTIVGHVDADGVVRFFEGAIPGRVVSPRGGVGFGWDSIFEADGVEKTFNEMSAFEKKDVSMRATALGNFLA